MKLYKNCAPERALIELERATAPLTSNDIAQALGIRQGRAVDVLTALHAGGKVTRTGTRRGFKYAIAKTGDKRDAVEAKSGNNQGNINPPAVDPSADMEPVSPVRSED